MKQAPKQLWCTRLRMTWVRSLLATYLHRQTAKCSGQCTAPGYGWTEHIACPLKGAHSHLCRNFAGVMSILEGQTETKEETERLSEFVKFDGAWWA